MYFQSCGSEIKFFFMVANFYIDLMHNQVVLTFLSGVLSVTQLCQPKAVQIYNSMCLYQPKALQIYNSMCLLCVRDDTPNF